MKRVLITGASSGIGKEFAYSFGSRGFDLALVARRKDELDKIKQRLEEDYTINVETIECDLLLEDSPKKLYDYCLNNNLNIGVLVNNAGYGDYGEFLDADINKLLRMVDLNNKALVSLSYYFGNDMKKEGYGHIINVGSVASFIPGPYMAVYYATKAFVLSFSTSLREELKAYNVRVSTLCPAPTKSPFWDVAGDDKMANNPFARTSKEAAETGYKLFEDNKAYAIDGKAFKLMINTLRHLPIEYVAKIMAKIQKVSKNKKVQKVIREN